MAAVPIYVWNGTAWQETGPTIPASPIKYQASAPSSFHRPPVSNQITDCDTCCI